MYTNRVTIGFVTLLVMACGLVLGGFTSPAAAETIVVTTLTDTADPPFNADGACGTGTLGDLPGADGLISLREALVAANNTPGEQTITFDPSLSGGTIMVNFDDADADTNPDPLPALCGGQTRLEGDLDSDDVPDITLEGVTFLVSSSAAGISIISSHNTIKGLQVQHFPFGIRIRAGDLTNPGTVTHTTVMHNILAESKVDGIFVATGNVPDSVVAHTTISQNLVTNNARVGILVVANLSAAGSATQIDHTTITDNEVLENKQLGIFLFSLGDHNVLSNATIAQNTVSGNTFFGINVNGGFAGADGNTLDLNIKDNTVTDNGSIGIRVLAAQDNSSDNHVVVRIRGNTLERNQVFGIEALAADGAANFPTGTSNNNVPDVRIERNTMQSQTGTGIVVAGGAGSPDGRAGAIADNNQANAIVMHNIVESSTDRGIELDAGAPGLASANTLDVRVAHNTVCHNDTDIVGEGGFSGNVLFVPNLGTGNVLAGQIFQNTATTVTVQDGAGAPGNQANVTQFNNDPCP